MTLNLYFALVGTPTEGSFEKTFSPYSLVTTRLGRAVERLDEIKNLRSQPAKWLPGQFVHPHDACFTPAGDIMVAEWVSTGRVTKLERVT